MHPPACPPGAALQVLSSSHTSPCLPVSQNALLRGTPTPTPTVCRLKQVRSCFSILVALWGPQIPLYPGPLSACQGLFLSSR